MLPVLYGWEALTHSVFVQAATALALEGQKDGNGLECARYLEY